MDLAFMPNFMGWRYILIVIDVYSEKIFAIALKKKNGPLVGKALQTIIDSVKSPITCLQSDQGISYLYSVHATL